MRRRPPETEPVVVNGLVATALIALVGLLLSGCGTDAANLEDAEHLVAIAPQRGESFYARGVALAHFGCNREAIADFDRGHRIRPELVYVSEARSEA